MSHLDTLEEMKIIWDSNELGEAINCSWQDHQQLQKAKELFEQYAQENPACAINMAFAILLLTCRKFDDRGEAYCAPELAVYILQKYPTLVNTYDERGATPVMYALRWKKFNVLVAMLNFKPDLTLPSLEKDKSETGYHACLDKGWNVLEGCFYWVCMGYTPLDDFNILRLHQYHQHQFVSLVELRKNVVKRIQLDLIDKTISRKDRHLMDFADGFENKVAQAQDIFNLYEIQTSIGDILSKELSAYGPKGIPSADAINKFIFKDCKRNDAVEDEGRKSQSAPNITALSIQEQAERNASMQTANNHTQSVELVMFSAINASSFTDVAFINNFVPTVNRFNG